MKRIKALNKVEFEQACSNGEVYGQYRGLYVYIELGQEQEYRESTQDIPKQIIVCLEAVILNILKLNNNQKKVFINIKKVMLMLFCIGSIN